MTTTLVQMCASHIVSKRRLRALVRMLHSIVDQSVRAPVWLSVSSVPELREEAAAALSAFDVTVRWREREMSQFEHYASLASEVESEYAWCILCDDDDYCHPNRVAWYMAAIYGCDADADAVLCSNGTLGAMFPGATELGIEGLEDHAAANPRSVGLGGSEHWMFAARTGVLRAFCDTLSCVGPSVLKNVGCDLVWRNLLRLSRCKITTSPTWLYAKTMETDVTFGHASLSYDGALIQELCTAYYPLLQQIAGIPPEVAKSRMEAHRILLADEEARLKPPEGCSS
jgi:hypothetical protein